MARENRLAIEANLRDFGTYTLPAGNVAVDAPPNLPSGSVLAGDAAKGTAIVNQGSGPVFSAHATGLGYLNVEHITGPLRVGEWCFRLKYDWQYTGTPRPLLCQIASVAADGTFKTNPASDPAHNCIARFRNAWPCGQPKEGARAVTLTVPATGLSVGSTLFLTDGPSFANASRGEYRRIVALSGQTVTLDRPLRSSYGPAVLAAVDAFDGVTLRNVSLVAQPNGHPVTWGASFKGHTNLRLERVKLNGALDIVTCANATLVDCSGPAVQLNGSTDCRLTGCRFGAFYAEEGVSDVDAVDCEFGEGRHKDANCVAGWFQCSRLRFARCRVVAAGKPEWPPSAAFMLGGRECSLVDCEVSGSQGGWTLLSGDGLMVRGFRTDGGFQFTGGKSASLSQLRGPYFELLGDDPKSNNRVVDADNVKASAGWQKSLVKDWVP